VAHSIELLLAPPGEAAIRALWQNLDDAGLPSQAHVTSPTNRPHITVVAAQRIRPEVDDALRGLVGRFPVGCVLGAPVVFGGPRLTLARLIVPNTDLLELHAEVYRRSLPYVEGQPFAHCSPGHWTAHATLGRRFTAEQIGIALGLGVGMSPEAGVEAAGLRRWDSDQRIDHLLVG
jgi:hypothetical protein